MCEECDRLKAENRALQDRLSFALQGLLISEESVKGYATLLAECERKRDRNA